MKRLDLIMMVLLAACNPQTDTAGSKSVETTEIPETKADSGGVGTAEFNAESENQQRFSPGSGTDLGESSVTLPPGALAVDGDVSVGTGPSLLSDSSASELGAAGASAQGSPMMISSTEPIQPNSALQISLDTGAGAALTFDNSRYAMLFKVVGSGFVKIGIIPRNRLTFVDRVAKTVFSYPQAITSVVFQAIETTTVITEAKEADSSGTLEFSEPNPDKVAEPTDSGEIDGDSGDGSGDGSGGDGTGTDLPDGTQKVIIDKLYGDGTSQYLNLEDDTLSGQNDRDMSAELEFDGTNLHTTCDINKFAPVTDKAFAELTYADLASIDDLLFQLLDVPAATYIETGAVLAMVAVDENCAAIEPKQIAKIKIHSVAADGSSVELEVETLSE